MQNRPFLSRFTRTILALCMAFFVIFGLLPLGGFNFAKNAQAYSSIQFVDTFNATGTWKTPSDITAAQIEVWGGGGSGGGASTTNNSAGGGGAGGAYARKNSFTVAAADAAYTVTVGGATTAGTNSATGNTSWFRNNSTTSGGATPGVLAVGGAGGVSVTTATGGNGATGVTTGSCSDCDAIWAGGNGAKGVNTNGTGGGGGGGAGASNSAKGTSASASISTANKTGATGTGGGGNGGSGAANSAGGAGAQPGGGGAGGQRGKIASNFTGGQGQAGIIMVTYSYTDSGPQFRALGTQGTSTTAGNANFGVAPGIPSGTLSGDLMILAITAENTTGTNTYAATGWSAVPTLSVERNATSPNIQLNLMYKFAGASESSPTIAVTGTCANGCSAYIITYGGVDSTTPFDVTTTGATAAAATTLATTTITPTTASSRVVNFVATGDDNTLGINTNQELGFTARLSGASGNYNADQSLGIADRSLNSPAAVNMLTWNQTANGPDIWANLTVALRPDQTNRYWIGGAGTWDATTTHWALCSGCNAGASAPAASSKVHFDANSGAGTVTTSGTTTDVATDIDFTGFTGTFSHATGTTVTVGSSTAGNLTFDSGMTYTIGSATTSILKFVSSAAGAQNITSATLTLPSLDFEDTGSGLGTWSFADDLTMSGTLTIGTGDSITNGAARTITMTNTGANALTGAGSFINQGVFNYAGTSINITTFTHTASGNTVAYSGASPTCNGTSYYNLTFSGSGTVTCAVTTVSGALSMTGTESWSTGANLVVSGTGSVGDGTTLTQGAFTLEFDGDFTLGGGTSGAYGCAASAGTLTLKGNLSVSAGSTWTKTNCGTITFSKGSSQTITDNTASCSSNPAACQDLGNVTTATSSTSVSTATNIELTSLSIGTGTTFSIATDTVSLTGTGTPLTNSGTFTVTGSTVIYNDPAGGNTITIPALTFNNLNLDTVFDTTPAETFSLSGNVTASVVTIGQSSSTNTDILNIGTNTLTLTGTGTPLNRTAKGTCTCSSGTVTYADVSGGNSINVAFVTYGNLNIGTTADATAADTYNLISGTTVNGSITIGNSGSTNSDILSTTASNLSLFAGTITISSKGELDANSSAVTVTGTSFTNNGSYTGGASITFSNSGTVTIGGTASTTFTGFTDTTAGSTLKFANDAGGTTPLFTFAGTTTITGAVGNHIIITSDNQPTNRWMAHFDNATSTITSVTVSYSDCDGTSQTVSLDSDSTNGTNNGACWSFFVPGVTVSGILYSDEGSTALTGVSVGIKIAKNGVLQSGSNTSTNSGTGGFTLGTVSSVAIGDVLTVYADDATNNGVVVTKAGATSGSLTLNIYKSEVIVRYETGTSIDSTALGNYCASGCTGTAANIPFSYSSGTQAVTVSSGAKLLVWTGKTYAPGGSVTTTASSTASGVSGDVGIQTGATLDMGTNALSVGGDFTATGTFTKSTGQTTTFTATGTGFTITPNGNFDAVTFNGSGGGWTPAAAMTCDGNLTVTAGTFTTAGFAFTAAGTTTVNGGTLTLDNNTGTKLLTGAVTASSGTLNGASTGIEMRNGITQSSTGTVSITGTTSFTTTASQSLSGTLSFGPVTSGSGVTLTNNGTVTSSGTVTLTGNWAQANGSTLSLSSSTPFAGAGTFSASTATNTVTYSGGAETIKDPNGGTLHTYSNLNLQGSGAKTMTSITAVNNLALSGTATAQTGANLVVAGTLNVGSGTTLTQGAFTLEADGATTIGGTFNCAVSASTFTLKGDLTISSGATWTKTNCGTLTFGKGAAQVITDSTATKQDLGAVSIPTASTSVSTATDVTVTSVNIGASATLDISNDTLLVTGSGAAGSRPFVNGGTFTTTSSTVDYEGSSATDVETTSTTYNNLKLGATSDTGTGVTYTLNGSTTVATLLTVGNATSTNADTLALGSATLNLSGTGTPLTITSKGTLSSASATVNYTDTTGNHTITMASGTFANLGVGTASDSTTADTFTLGGATTVSGTLTVGNAASTNSDVLDGSSATLTLSGTGTPLTLTTKGTFTASTSTVNFTNVTGAQNITLASTTYNNLGAGTTSDTAAANTFTLGGATTVSGTLTVGNAASTNSDVLDGSSATLTLSGTGTPLTLTTKGTFTPSTSTVTYTGAGTDNLAAATYNNLTLNNGSGTFVIPAGGITLRGNMAITSASAVTKGGTVVFGIGGGNTQTYTDSTAGKDIGGVQVSANTGVSTLSLSSNATFTSVTVDASQVLTTNANTLTLTAASGIVSGSFTPSTGSTIAYVPSQASGSVTMPSGITYYNLTLNKASNTFVAPASIGITNNLNVTAGTLDLETNDPALTVAGTVTIAGTVSASSTSNLTLNSDFTNNGTFTPNSGTVILAPSSSAIQILGTSGTTFYNLTSTSAGKTIKIKNGNTMTINNQITLTGTPSSWVYLQSSTDGSQWTANLAAVSNGTLTYVAIKDAACSGNTLSSPNDTIYNLGNNGTCWAFIVRGGGGIGNGDSASGGGSVTGGGTGQGGNTGGNSGSSGGGTGVGGGGQGGGGGGSP